MVVARGSSEAQMTPAKRWRGRGRNSRQADLALAASHFDGCGRDSVVRIEGIEGVDEVNWAGARRQMTRCVTGVWNFFVMDGKKVENSKKSCRLFTALIRDRTESLVDKIRVGLWHICLLSSRCRVPICTSAFSYYVSLYRVRSS